MWEAPGSIPGLSIFASPISPTPDRPPERPASWEVVSGSRWLGLGLTLYSSDKSLTLSAVQISTKNLFNHSVTLFFHTSCILPMRPSSLMDKALLGEPGFARLCTQQTMEVRVLPGSLCTCGCHNHTPYFHPVNTTCFRRVTVETLPGVLVHVVSSCLWQDSSSEQRMSERKLDFSCKLPAQSKDFQEENVTP